MFTLESFWNNNDLANFNMKAFILSLYYFMSFVCMAQTSNRCDDVLINEFDEIAGVYYLHTKPIAINSQEDSVTFRLGYGVVDKGNVLFAINFKAKSMCVDSKNLVYTLFTDDTRLQVISDTDKNCLGRSIVDIDANLSIYKSKRIKAIRVYTSDGSVDVYLPSLESNVLTLMLNCLCNRLNK